MTTPRPPAPPQTPDDHLQPFAQALRERVPSREALLAEGKALTRQRRTARHVIASSVLSLMLLSGVWTLDPAWRSEDVQVAFGQLTRLTLEDGTAVLINSGSHLRIEHRLRSRQLELVRGEALFTVVHDDKPFSVRSQGVTVKDIGTVFDVRSDERGVLVGVIEGAVEVSNHDSGPQRLVAGEQVHTSAQTTGTVQPLRLDTLTAWQHGKLRFDGTPLSEVVADLQHYRQAPIRVADAHAAQLRLSGEFDSASVEALIGLLPSILPVQVQRDAHGGVVLHSAH